MKKKMISVGLAVAMVGTLAACSGGSAGGAPAGGTELKLATMYPEEHADVQSVERAAAEIEKQTDGEVSISVYPSNQLGDYTQVYEEVMAGTIDMATITIPTNFDERLEMLTMPYLVTTFDEAKELYAPGSEFFNELNEIQGEQGIETLNIYLDGFMGVGMVDPLSDPMDPGKKHPQLVRVPPVDSFLWTAEAMGYNTVSVPYADLYSALQTGVADGWVGGSAYVNQTSFGDVIKQFVDSRYIMELVVTIVNKDTFESLTPEQQEIMQETFAAEALLVADEREALDEDAMKTMADAGIDIYEPTQDELDAMATHVREVAWPKYEKVLGEELLGVLMKAQN
ncbi:TRAP transporter substrate-binding protein DctP [Leucobacter sp. gxy201]|uniref:TRAP transporter substrate-binding protein DctP n=1 Tax=Leucobacter sp. gxy201 TaxID=2957200 RepID=UPI003DA18FDD